MEKNISKDSFEISKTEVLRYLGHKGQNYDENLNMLIDECIIETKNIIMPRAVYELKKIKQTNSGVEILNTNLILEGKDIKNHLKNSHTCVCLAATLGNEIERRTRLYEKINLTKALIIDACATTAIEAVCDLIEDEVKIYAEKENKSITFRYSPGYGDLPLDVQSSFLNVLNAGKKIGLTVSENNLLFPRKSVTAIIGIIDKNIEIKKKSCKECENYSTCSFRREGESCGA